MLYMPKVPAALPMPAIDLDDLRPGHHRCPHPTFTQSEARQCNDMMLSSPPRLLLNLSSQRDERFGNTFSLIHGCGSLAGLILVGGGRLGCCAHPPTAVPVQLLLQNAHSSARPLTLTVEHRWSTMRSVMRSFDEATVLSGIMKLPSQRHFGWPCYHIAAKLQLRVQFVFSSLFECHS